MLRSFSFVAAMVLLGATTLHAAVAERRLPYRGYLERDGGKLNDTISMHFTLYSVPTAGTAVCSAAGGDADPS